MAFPKSSTTQTNAGVVQVTRFVGGLTPDEAPNYAAEAQGYYAQNGIDVTPVVLSGTSAAELAVAESSSPYVFEGAGALYDLVGIAANNGSLNHVELTGMEGAVNPVGLIYLNTTGATITPADLVGKTIGVPSGSESLNMFMAFLKTEGISPSQLTIDNIGFSDLGDALFSKSVFAIVEFISDYAALQPEAQSVGLSANYMLFSNYGLPPVGTGIVVQDNLVNNDPAVARAITNATLYGYIWCIKNPGPCAQDFVNINPSFNYTQTLQEWDSALTFEIGWNATTQGNLTPLQWGYINSNSRQRT